METRKIQLNSSALRPLGKPQTVAKTSSGTMIEFRYWLGHFILSHVLQPLLLICVSACHTITISRSPAALAAAPLPVQNSSRFSRTAARFRTCFCVALQTNPRVLPVSYTRTHSHNQTLALHNRKGRKVLFMCAIFPLSEKTRPG